VLDKHYLRQLSTEVSLANAGFNAKFWKGYVLPRSRGTSASDPHIQRLVEFFYPKVYASYERAKAAFEGNPMSETDVTSTTNFRFISNLIEVTYFWLQDAVVLLQKFPSLASVAPFITLLRGGAEIRADFELLGNTVMNSLSRTQVEEHQELMSQNELLHAVESGCQTQAHELNERLGKLPERVAHAQMQAFMSMQDQMYCQVEHRVEQGITNIFRRMVRNADNDPVEPPPPFGVHTPQRPVTSPPAASCGSGCSGGRYGSSSEPAGSSSEAAVGRSSSEAAVGRSSSEAAVGSSSEAAVGSSSEAAVGSSSEAAVSGDHRANQMWHAPLPSETVPPHGKRPRKPRPRQDSSTTGPRTDGFYLGNDLHTVTDVWKARTDLLAWLETQPERSSEDWGPTCGNKEEKAQQGRLRMRRRGLWTAIKQAAQGMGSTEDEVVKELQAVQDELCSGISRVEEWGASAKKKAGSSNILQEAQSYKQALLAYQQSSKARNVI
jgi:hypothetical protein